MPNENTPNPVPDPAANNAAVARKVAAQDIAGQPTATGEFGDAQSALDKLAAAVAPPKPEDAPPKPEDAPPKPDVVRLEPDPAVEAAKLKADEELKQAEEFFKDAPKLPPNASPKSSEAFSSIKIKAAQEISARESQIMELQKRLEAAGKPTPEQLTKEKEVEELRQWRAKLDVEYDPKFKEFDKSIAQQREFIYAQLLANPQMKPEVIEQIKKFGGPEKVNMVKIFDAMKDPITQRIVESKLADIQMAMFQKDAAIKTARENLGQYLESKQKEGATVQIARAQEVQSKLEEHLGKLTWFAEKTAPANADEETKKEITEHNEFLTKIKGEIGAVVQDDSPETRAVLLTAAAQLFYLQRRVPGLEAKLAASEKALAETTAKWEAVKASGRSRLHESSAPAGGITQPKAGADVNLRAGDALDAIAKQVMEEQAAKAGR